MFLCDDVIDFKGQKVICLVDEAVFTTITSPLPNEAA